MTAPRRGRMFGTPTPATPGAGSGMVIGDAVTGGTATRVLYEGAGPVLADSAALTFTVGSGTLSATVLQATGLTAGRIPFAGVGGALTDDADLTFSTDTLTATKMIASTSLTVSGLTAGRVPIVSTAGLLADDAGLLYDATTDTLTSGALVLSSATAPVLQATITDGSAATQIEGHRLRHLSSVTATAGISVYQSFWCSNGVAGGGTLREAARIHGMLRVVTDAGENGTILFQTMQSGAVANGAHLQGAAFYGATSVGVGSVSATGVTTNSMLITASASAMVIYTSSLAANGGHVFAGTVNTSGNRSFVISTPSANTGITTTTERIGHVFGSAHTNGVPGLASIVQTWANGTVALQRENVWVAPTYLQASGTQVMTVAMHHDFGSAPIITGTTNSITGARVARLGGNAAVGVTAAATTYVGLEIVPSTITYTGSTQVTSTVGASQLRLDILTLTDASAVTVDQAATLDIVGAVAQAGSVTITNPLAILVRAGTTKLNALLDLSGISAGSPNVKITKTSDTPTTSFSAVNATNAAPSGFIEITEGGTSKYIPFYT